MKVEENLERIRAEKERVQREANADADAWIRRGTFRTREFERKAAEFKNKLETLQWVLDMDWGEEE